jgi:hypothetical protein
MSSRTRFVLLFTIGVGVAITAAPARAADDASATDASVDAPGSLDAASVDASESEVAAGNGDDGGGDSSPESSTPLACDGALCDTTNGAELGGSCEIARHTSGGAGFVAGIASAIALLAARRARRPVTGSEGHR